LCFFFFSFLPTRLPNKTKQRVSETSVSNETYDT
jgi:hypothetical protein